MAVTSRAVTLSAERLSAIQRSLLDEGLDGWLLYDFRGSNPIATSVLGIPPLTRRLFVLIPAVGDPIALTHRIEQQPWRTWIGENRLYLSWRSLEDGLRRLLMGRARVAMEYSPGGGVPYVDLIPAGVREMVIEAGVVPVSSADLITAVYSRWSGEEEASHRRAAGILHDTVHRAFERIRHAIAEGSAPREAEIRDWIVPNLQDAGLAVGADAVVAVNANAANPHYSPLPEGSSELQRGDLILIDLWGKESDDAVYADQTWMAYLGMDPPQRVNEIWRAVRDARDEAVSLVRSRFEAGAEVSGYEVDEAARSLIVARGFGDAFIHRTGHSIDRDLHGSGPNIDNLETRDTRKLIQGIGFSIEPGIYIQGEIGVRSEIDVFMGADGPEVTTPNPQREVYLIGVP